MKLTLKRVSVTPEGAFGVLLDERGLPFAVTLEQTDALFDVKIPVGTYRCVPTQFYRGGYPTFEITGVPGHTRLLFHMGNYEKDTEGCVLVGSEFRGTWIAGSRLAFNTLMEKTAGQTAFNLEVID